jgi:hypothetical protein
MPEDANLDDALLHRWPDAELRASFHGLLAIYRGLCAKELATSGCEVTRVAYRRLCCWIRRALAPAEARAAPAAPDREMAKARSLLLDLKAKHGADWLQALASILAMLLHYEFDAREPSLLVNRRRPGKPFPTYPSSPATVRLLADLLASRLLPADLAVACRDAVEARHFAARVLTFRVLDPSFESGQLLLAFIQAVLQRVLSRCPQDGRATRLLAQELIPTLCRDCLWGIDRNELGIPAFALLVALLGDEHGARGLRPRHLFAADALDPAATPALPLFDGILNNPPWGESLMPGERDRLRSRFPSIQHRTNTYVSFTEMAVERLRPDGAFAIILPSNALTSRNAAGLRRLLLDQTAIEGLVLLPRAAFGDATVRGLVLTGRAHPSVPPKTFQSMIFPLVKRMKATGPPQCREVAWKDLLELGSRSWSDLLAEHRPTGWGPTVALGSVARVATGIRLYAVGRGRPQQSPETVRARPFSLPGPAPGATPVIHGRHVLPFKVLEPCEYVRFGSWLAWVGDHDGFRQRPRVFVRELCRRDGRLSTAVARDGYVPLHGVLTILPTAIDCRILVGILNSAVAARYVQAHAASFSKVDFQRVTVQELCNLPIPVAALGPAAGRRKHPGARPSPQRALRREIIRLVESLSAGTLAAPRSRAKLDRLDEVISALFTAGGSAPDG